jgi:hypothetical protein
VSRRDLRSGLGERYQEGLPRRVRLWDRAEVTAYLYTSTARKNWPMNWGAQ